MTAISVCTAAPGSPEWLNERLNGIGASEAATIFTDNDGDRINPYASPYELWQIKTGQSEGFTGNYKSRRGQHMEAFILRHYAEQHPRHVVETAPDDIPSIMAHPDTPEVRCSLDALVHNSDESLVCEVKAITSTQARKWADGNVPDMYLVQVQYQLLVTGLQVAHIAVDIAGEYEERVVPRNDALCAHLHDTVKEWWTKHVVGGEPPALEPTSKIDRALLPTAYTPDVTAEPVVLPTFLVERLRDAKAAKAAAVTDYEVACAEVQVALGEAVAGVDSTGSQVCTWGPVKGRTTVDRKALADDGLLEKYQTTGQPGRMFRVK